MREERESERQKHVAKKEAEYKLVRETKATVEAVKRDLYALFTHDNPQERGGLLEGVLNRLFKTYGILIREAFRRRGKVGEGVLEQIDGVIELEGEIYLVEVKWLKGRVGKGDVSEHLVRVFSRHASRGIFVSATEFTAAAVTVCEEALSQATVFLCTLEEVVRLLDREGDLKQLLKRKLHAAVIDKKPYMSILS